MKKIILTNLIIFIYTGSLFAQTSLGIFGGAISGNFSGDTPKKGKYSPKMGYAFGLSADFFVKEDVIISFMPSLISTGSKLQFLDSLGENYVDSVIISFNTIALPVLMKIISNNRKWQFSGGLELSLPIKLEADNGEELFDLKDEIKDVGLNILFGIGYRIPVGKSHIILDLTYSQGLLNIVDRLDEDEAYIPRMKPTSFRLTAAWNIGLGKKNTEN